MPRFRTSSAGAAARVDQFTRWRRHGTGASSSRLCEIGPAIPPSLFYRAASVKKSGKSPNRKTRMAPIGLLGYTHNGRSPPMRKWLALAIPAAAILGIAGYWLLSSGSDETNERPPRSVVTRQAQRDDGDAEASDVIEPLIVDRGTPDAPTVIFTTPFNHGPLPRVTWSPGMDQPVRPDATTGRVLRMPYADEDDILGLRFDPIQRILESKLPELNLFEESEERDPMVVPPPVMDPHHHY